MSAAAFATLMILIVFGFIAAMIWAYRKNDYQEEKPQVETVELNCLNDTLMTITSKPGRMPAAEELESKPQDGVPTSEDQSNKPEKEEVLVSRKKMIQTKNHIKKSAADEYFEKTKGVANEILQPKTK